MTTLEILEKRKDEIVNKTIELLPRALNDGGVNRTFYVKETEDGEIAVGYFVYQGHIYLSENCFFTIYNFTTFDPKAFGYSSLEEVDFREISWDKKIEDKIDEVIYDLWCEERSKKEE